MSALSSAANGGSRFDYHDPADNLYAFGKIWAGYDTPVVGGFHGLMYLRIPGRRMIPLFGYVGTGVMLARIDENRELSTISTTTCCCPGTTPMSARTR